jgi:TonB family protein
MRRVRPFRVLLAVLAGLVLLTSLGLVVVFRDPVTREQALTYLDDLHPAQREYAARYNREVLRLAGEHGELEKGFGRAPTEAPVGPSAATSNALQSSPGFQPAEPIHRASPDWRQFPSGHIPGKGGVYRLTIDEAGTVTKVEVVRPAYPRVDEVIVETLRQWRFRPARLEEAPIASDYTVTLAINVK